MIQKQMNIQTLCLQKALRSLVRQKSQLAFFSEVFKKHVKYHLSSKKNIDAINLCGEMHGFILPSDIDNLQDEKFISWRANNSKKSKT